MAKAKTKRTAKTSDVKVGNTTIKGATEGDKQAIAAGKAAARTDADAARANTRSTTATPEAQPTPKQQRAAAQKLFDKADEDGKAAIIAETRAGIAARGY